MMYYNLEVDVLNNNINNVKKTLDYFENDKKMLLLLELDLSLKQAAFKGYLKMTELLVSYGADVNVHQGEPLSVASQEGHFDVVKFLVSKGANVHAENNFAIRKASNRGHLEIVQFLYDNGANIQADDNYAIKKACNCEHFEVVKFLIQKGADVNAENDYCIRRISNLNNLPIMKLLIDNGANIHADNDYILRYATDNDLYDITDYLISIGMDIINNPDPIVNSCRKGNIKIVKLLIKHGANIHINNELPFVVATINRRSNVIKYLLKTINYDKDTLNYLLITSSDHGNLKVLKMLLKKNADINAKNGSPLQKASLNGDIKIVKYLLYRGAELKLNISLEEVEKKCQSEEELIKEIYELWFQFEKDEETVLKTKSKCPICLVNMENKEKIRCGLCNNVFDKTCITQWLKVKYSCPYCRESNKFFLLSNQK